MLLLFSILSLTNSLKKNHYASIHAECERQGNCVSGKSNINHETNSELKRFLIYIGIAVGVFVVIIIVLIIVYCILKKRRYNAILIEDINENQYDGNANYLKDAQLATNL